MAAVIIDLKDGWSFLARGLMEVLLVGFLAIGVDVKL
jgi:hypothetical protein